MLEEKTGNEKINFLNLNDKYNGKAGVILSLNESIKYVLPTYTIQVKIE